MYIGGILHKRDISTVYTLYYIYAHIHNNNFIVAWYNMSVCLRGIRVHTKETLLGDSPWFGAKTHITGTHAAVANNNLSSSYSVYPSVYTYHIIRSQPPRTAARGLIARALSRLRSIRERKVKISHGNNDHPFLQPTRVINFYGTLKTL